MSEALDALLTQDGERIDAARALSERFDALCHEIDEYREAWKKATAHGWVKTDLVRAGFIDIQRLPTPRRTRATATNDTVEEHSNASSND